MSENTSIEKQNETRLMVEDTSNMSMMLDTAKFEQAQRIARLMAAASLMPKHLKGDNPTEAMANSFLVVNQAYTWGINPFAVAQETYVVGGKLGYQGKLVAAIINSKARLQRRLSYTFNDGKGDALAVKISGTFQGEQEPREVTLSVGDAKTSNQMWVKDPRQKLIYSGVVKWARRHAPELILGIATDDDIDRITESAEGQRFAPISSLELPVEAVEEKPLSRTEQLKAKAKAAKVDAKEPLDELLDLCERDGIRVVEDLIPWIKQNDPASEEFETLTDLSQATLKLVIKSWDQVVEDVRGGQK